VPEQFINRNISGEARSSDGSGSEPRPLNDFPVYFEVSIGGYFCYNISFYKPQKSLNPASREGCYHNLQGASNYVSKKAIKVAGRGSTSLAPSSRTLVMTFQSSVFLSPTLAPIFANIVTKSGQYPFPILLPLLLQYTPNFHRGYCYNIVPNIIPILFAGYIQYWQDTTC